MAWTIEFEQDAIRQLNRLDKRIRGRIVDYVERRVAASGNPRQFGKPLLENDRLVIVLVSVGHRRDVYR